MNEDQSERNKVRVCDCRCGIPFTVMFAWFARWSMERSFERFDDPSLCYSWIPASRFGSSGTTRTTTRLPSTISIPTRNPMPSNMNTG